MTLMVIIIDEVWQVCLRFGVSEEGPRAWVASHKMLYALRIFLRALGLSDSLLRGRLSRGQTLPNPKLDSLKRGREGCKPQNVLCFPHLFFPLACSFAEVCFGLPCSLREHLPKGFGSLRLSLSLSCVVAFLAGKPQVNKDCCVFVGKIVAEACATCPINMSHGCMRFH